MSTPQSKSSSLRWSERLFPGSAGSPFRVSESLSAHASQSRNTDREGGTESPKFLGHSGSPGRRLTTLPEVLDAMMEAEPEHPEYIERESSVHRRIPHVQIQGGNIWREFNGRAKILGDDLQKFHDAVQGLGSSLDIAHSARRTRDCLSLVAWGIQENARSLFPLAIKSADVPQVLDDLYMTEAKYSPRWPPAATSSVVSDREPQIGSLHSQLMDLATSVEKLRDALEQFPEFNNLGKRPLKWFESDLKYWSSCLEQYDGNYDTHEVRVYIHDLSNELGKRFNEVSQYITEYIAHVPNVRLLQKHAMSNLHTLATIATFFSAVTATTIQYSVSIGDARILSRIVLGLWFTSLVFSIASALNSSLALMWRSATYSAPEMRIPSWLWIWIQQCPTSFLLISVVTFLAGLVCFAASTQPRVTWIIILIFVVISAFSLAALLFLLVADKWSSYRLQGRQMPHVFILTKILGEKTGNVLPTHIQHSASWSIGQLSRARAFLALVTPNLGLLSPREPEEVKTELAADKHDPSTPISEPAPQVHHYTPSRRSSTLPPMQQLWRRTIRKVILISRATQANTEWSMQEADRMTALESRLRSIVPDRITQHEAGPETADIQFHPDGTSLAICGKRLSMIWDIDSSTDKYDPLRHYVGQARQVIWLTSGSHLLIRTNRAVHVWTMFPEIRRTKKTITRYESTSFILPIPNMKGYPLPQFLSIEGNNMNKLCLMDINGDEQMTHDFDSVSIQHVDVVPDGSCVLLAVDVTEGQQGVRPVKAAPARKLMVFNLETQEVEHDVPLWYEVRHVTIAGNGQTAIITYQSYPPPQLWLLRRTKEGIRLSLHRQFCARERRSAVASDPIQSVMFSGQGHFLHMDRFIICTTTEGKIYIWRRDNFDPVYVLDNLTADQDRPLQIACSRTSQDFTFATRSQNGTIRIWKIQNPIEVTMENSLGLSNYTSTLPPQFSASPQLGQLPELSQGFEVESEALDTQD